MSNYGVSIQLPFVPQVLPKDRGMMIQFSLLSLLVDPVSRRCFIPKTP